MEMLRAPGGVILHARRLAGPSPEPSIAVSDRTRQRLTFQAGLVNLPIPAASSLPYRLLLLLLQYLTPARRREPQRLDEGISVCLRRLFGRSPDDPPSPLLFPHPLLHLSQSQAPDLL